MAICRYDHGGTEQFALYRDGSICPLSDLSSDLVTGHELFELGIQWLSSLPEPADDQWQGAPERLLSPLPTPEKVVCIGLNYRDHALESGLEIPTQPVVFNKFPTAIRGHGDEIKLPRVSQKVDYEAELVVVIGATAKHVSRDKAMDYVFGYTCGNDVSARDWQKGTPAGQWLLGKTFDSFAPIGPCVVTKNEMADPENLRIQLHLNGEVMQDSSTSQLIFSIPELIEHITQVLTLHPGDIIFTGTPPGVGAARKPPVFLKPGDTCSVEIEQIGTLTNTCVAE